MSLPAAAHASKRSATASWREGALALALALIQHQRAGTCTQAPKVPARRHASCLHDTTLIRAVSSSSSRPSTACPSKLDRRAAGLAVLGPALGAGRGLPVLLRAPRRNGAEALARHDGSDACAARVELARSRGRERAARIGGAGQLLRDLLDADGRFGWPLGLERSCAGYTCELRGATKGSRPPRTAVSVIAGIAPCGSYRGGSRSGGS